jgi:S1-C subfamily serine protease
VNAAEFDAFLKDAGYAYHTGEGELANNFYFKDRGCYFVGVANERDPQFLYIMARFTLTPGSHELERLPQIMSDLENEYPVVKLRAQTSGEPPFFIVATEQFEADVDCVRAIFWRTLDIMQTVGNECFKRLAPATPEKTVQNAESADVESLEAALQRGCANNDAVTPDSPLGKIRRSLALVDDHDSGRGTAFCVASTSESSLYVTNAHVVGDHDQLTLYRQYPAYQKMLGQVVAKGNPDEVDLALVSVPVGGIPAVVMSSKTPRPDMPVAIAGYAQVQIWAAAKFGELLSAAHAGTITAIYRDGNTILHDALSRPGNSGSPLFDPATGEVYGVESGGWDTEREAVAVGQRALMAFLAQNNVKTSTALA